MYLEHDWVKVVHDHNHEIRWWRCSRCRHERRQAAFEADSYYTPSGDYAWSPNTLVKNHNPYNSGRQPLRPRDEYAPHEIEPACLRVTA